MMIYIDPYGKAPKDMVKAFSVGCARRMIIECEKVGTPIDLIDITFEMGIYKVDGGDGSDFLRWLARYEKRYPITFHNVNGYERKILERMMN